MTIMKMITKTMKKMTLMPKFHTNKSIRSLFLLTIGFAALTGCATAPTPAPVAPVTTVAPTPSETVIPNQEPVKPEPEPQIPVISPALQALRDQMTQKNYPEAKLNAHAIIDENPKSNDAAEALRSLAEIHMTDGKIAQAQLYADAAYALNSGDPQTLICLAKLAILHDQSDVAVKHLTEASKYAPKDPLPHIMRANVLLQFLDIERALEAAKTAHQLAPQNCHAVIIYADALFASKSYPEAIAQYENAQTQQCKIGEETLKNMAKLYEVHIQNPQKACEAYQKLHHIDNTNPYYKASMDYQCKAP